MLLEILLCDGKTNLSILGQHGTVQCGSVKGPYVDTRF